MNWHEEHHWVDVKFAGHDKSIGVERVSLDWWNRDVFNDIGERLEGLIDIARDTTNISFIRFAKLRIKAPNRMLDPVPRKTTFPVSEKMVFPRSEWRRVETESSTSDVVHNMNPNNKFEKQLLGLCNQHGITAKRREKLGNEDFAKAIVSHEPHKAEDTTRKNKISTRNKAFLMKWLWSFPKESNSLWHKVIKSKYGLNSNLWDAVAAKRATLRTPWKAISYLYGDFF
ncbi:hypothetical protein PanWU01x14_037490 [Parasponia andersonii]|uniref:Uncharacterized protein n=1 Tax=Parasponia andersonii TaxID=3476 RepID=A0A2P5DRV9_PARAD|nr:hypothetical protein PanWU01x14_037490 [Parasponia andersonii]